MTTKGNKVFPSQITSTTSKYKAPSAYQLLKKTSCFSRLVSAALWNQHRGALWLTEMDESPGALPQTGMQLITPLNCPRSSQGSGARVGWGARDWRINHRIHRMKSETSIKNETRKKLTNKNQSMKHECKLRGWLNKKIKAFITKDK